MRYDGKRSSKVKLLVFWNFLKKYVRLSRSENGFLYRKEVQTSPHTRLSYFELNLNSNFISNLTLVVHDPLATPTEHLR